MTLIIAYINKDTKEGIIAADKRITAYKRNKIQKKDSKIYSANIGGDYYLIGSAGHLSSSQFIKEYIKSNNVTLSDVAKKLNKLRLKNKRLTELILLSEYGEIITIHPDGSIMISTTTYHCIGSGHDIGSSILAYNLYYKDRKVNNTLFSKIFYIAHELKEGISTNFDTLTLKLDI